MAQLWRPSGGAAALAALLLFALLMGAADGVKLSEAAIMCQLRQVLNEADPVWLEGWRGWQPDSPAHHCDWEHVVCTADRVTALHLSIVVFQDEPAVAAGTSFAEGQEEWGQPQRQLLRWGPLQPALAQLERLEELFVQRVRGPRFAGLPPEWGTPGAFPRLRWLAVNGLQVSGPLPDIHPGAFPLLVDLSLEFARVPPSLQLPPSWGAALDVLPVLRMLSVQAPALGTLPASWARGFAALEQLVLVTTDRLATRANEKEDAKAKADATEEDELKERVSAPLPAEWANGFPRLVHLGIAMKGLHGSTIPKPWVQRGFPLIQHLSLSGMGLSGQLPEQLVERHPDMIHLALQKNNFSGTLPASWSRSKLQELLLADNALTGAAFPAAWLQPGTFSDLFSLILSKNRGLTGTLPGHLPWPHLRELEVEATGVEGQIPASWCQLALAKSLTRIVITATAVEPVLPQCMAQHMERAIVLTDAGVISARALSPAGSRPQGWPVALVAALAASLSLAALAAGTGIGYVLWRRSKGPSHHNQQQRQQQRHRRQHVSSNGGDVGDDGEQWQDVQLLLASQQRERDSSSAPVLVVAEPASGGSNGGNRSGSNGGICGSTTAKTSSTAPQPPSKHSAGSTPTVFGGSRRQRLASLLSAQLQHGSGGSGAGPQGRPGQAGTRLVELLPLEALPTVLSHQLVSIRRAVAADLSGRRPPAAAAAAAVAPGAPAPPPLHYHTLGGPGTGAGPSSSPVKSNKSKTGWQQQQYLDPQRAADLDAWTSAALSAWSPGVSGDYAPPRSRQWGMATDSLRLGAGQLEFVVGTDGEFVELGAGSFAVVYLAKLHGKPIAVKVFELVAGMDSSVVWREVSLLRRCTHPRIVPLLGVAIKGELVLLAMEVMHGGSLRVALQQPAWKGALRWADRGRQVAVDVAEALDFLHSQQIIHSDLKSANVLLSQDCRAFLADLGLAQVLAGSPATAAGFSRAYAAPEQLLGQRCTLAADIYSFGILLIQLFTQKHWDVRGQWRLPRAPDECPQGVVALIQECVYSDPLQRPTAAQALERLRLEAAQ